jgi:1-acyl-sn-glycerol-3-phosphate acyltransferase
VIKILSGLQRALGDLGGALLPLSVRELQLELQDRLRKAPIQLNDYGYDPFGFNPETASRLALPVALLYRYYFRAETHDIERVPPGRVLLIANHAGQLPYDGVMLTAAMLLDADPPRLCRGMGEYFIWRLPWLGVTAARGGTIVGTPENCVAMLEAEECVMAFPEGARGISKPFRQRYQLEPFGLGFMRLALAARTPIVPVAFVGSEEQQPGLANFRGVAEAVGLPSLPITVTFPWLGPLGLLVALPVKYHIYFGEPLHFEGDSSEEDAVVQEKVDVVRRSIADLFERGRKERRGIFR